MPETSFAQVAANKKTTEPVAAAPPKIAELSALEQELQKLHSNRRIAAEQQQMMSSSPPQDPTHIKTYSEVLKQEPPAATLAPPQDPARVRKISRFNVSVVKEQESKTQQVPQQVPQPSQTQIPQMVQQQQVPQQQTFVESNVAPPNNNKQQLNLNLQQQPQQAPVEIMSLMPKTLIGKHKGMCASCYR